MSFPNEYVGKSRHYDVLLKLLLVGDSSVGKTALVCRFADDVFEANFVATIGIDFKIKTLDIGGQRVKLQVWDTAGQERFRTITHSYYRGANGILLVYSITDRRTFDHVAKWLDDISSLAADDVEVVIVGNKSDLEDKRIVSTNAGETLASENNVRFLETSAKEDTNVTQAFMLLAETVLSKRPRQDKEKDEEKRVRIGVDDASADNGGKCC